MATTPGTTNNIKIDNSLEIIMSETAPPMNVTALRTPKETLCLKACRICYNKRVSDIMILTVVNIVV